MKRIYPGFAIFIGIKICFLILSDQGKTREEAGRESPQQMRSCYAFWSLFQKNFGKSAFV
jgi:hypothetical protein